MNTVLMMWWCSGNGAGVNGVGVNGAGVHHNTNGDDDDGCVCDDDEYRIAYHDEYS